MRYVMYLHIIHQNEIGVLSYYTLKPVKDEQDLNYQYM